MKQEIRKISVWLKTTTFKIQFSWFESPCWVLGLVIFYVWIV